MSLEGVDRGGIGVEAEYQPAAAGVEGVDRGGIGVEAEYRPAAAGVEGPR